MMETTMNRISLALLTLLMCVFLGAGFYGLFQHATRALGDPSSIARVR